MKTIGLLFLGLVLAGSVRAQIPVTDLGNMAANQIAHAEDIAKWVQSIANLQTQINQMNQQLSLQTDLHSWAGNPVIAGGNVNLALFNVSSLAQAYGRSQAAIVNVPDSLASLAGTSSGTYRALQDTDLNGNSVQHDPLTYRRFTVMDAQQQNYQQVSTDTTAQQQQLEQDLAGTLIALKNASTDAEVQKQSAKINALNGQLTVLSAIRKDQADQVAAQKAANDARSDEERMAAEELAAKDDYLANQRITTYMQTIKLRQNEPQ
jgi:hypothetical protein